MTTFPILDQYHLQSEAFSRAIRTGAATENNIDVAVGNMRVIDALFRSAAHGGWETISAAGHGYWERAAGYWSGSSPGSTPGLWSLRPHVPGT